jgi:acetyl-CoA carboxylase, biotin carboxylase subunit
MAAKLFRKILIANRGEIAVRIIRACREMGIVTVAVFSDADRAALHVRIADEAYHIGPAIARDSYLNIEKVLDVALRCGAEAIHPGYGFLSENAEFARACNDANLKFIGPPPQAMEIMGSKTRARQAMDKAGVPRVPGSTSALASLDEAHAVAESIGYPIMLKAAAGGGGKGMRLVERKEHLASAFEGAQSEAQRSFKSGELYIEKLIVNPRHVEVQVFGDEHGNLVHLGERECSVQRRHQKLIEEAPSPIVDAGMRQAMGATAVRVAKAAGYFNAGTIEFLVDQQKNFYFLEMNTRLQVEHPVTEQITGLDLVQLQIRIAAGERLPFSQEQVQLRGHAIEVRIYAEDPDNNFFPSPGKIQRLITPSGPGIREDSGIYEGWIVPLDYDPMLSKLIAYAPTRKQAIKRLLRALDEYFIGGIASNLALFCRILSDPAFEAGEIDTGYLDRLLATHAAQKPAAVAIDAQMIAAAAAILASLDPIPANGIPFGSQSSRNEKWKTAARNDAVRSS